MISKKRQQQKIQVLFTINIIHKKCKNIANHFNRIMKLNRILFENVYGDTEIQGESSSSFNVHL